MWGMYFLEIHILTMKNAEKILASFFRLAVLQFLYAVTVILPHPNKKPELKGKIFSGENMLF